ncbi:baseplate J/gp47 family protein [Dickeya lacustris]|uniref:Baseplate J/gp47 family protein n=1 Tax=Dickeya lacustris TaxID=2259638 RepID=A0ABY8G4Q4_9GAMM|nr:baseplate J/gp47 family protein [Dickeya lacustris]WFN54933.1 baseplate J/gp47 family protein [Dickeya lacustris]
MTDTWAPPPPPPATAQHQRLPAALTDGYFQVDELSFETLLVLARDIAANITFDDGSATPAGNWRALFDNSDITAMATLLSLDARREQSRFRHARSQGLPALLTYLLQLYFTLDNSYRTLTPGHSPGADRLSLMMQTVISASLARPFQLLVMLAQALSPGHPSLLAPPALHQLDPLWGIRYQSPHFHASTYPLLSAAELPALSVLDEQLQGCFSCALNAIIQWQRDCRSAFEAALAHDGHAPQMALYLSFLRQLARAQARINRFTERHLDFYYRDVLQQQPLPGPTDAVFLKLSLEARQSEPVLLAAGSAFSAGQDAQQRDIRYHSERPLWVSDVSVTAVYSLLLKRDPLMSPERELGFVTAIHSDSLWPWQADTPRTRTLLALFGETPGLHQHAQPRSPGIAILDPVLYLPEGRRQVSLTLNLHEAERPALAQQVALLRDAPPYLLPHRLKTALAILAQSMPALLPATGADAAIKQLVAALTPMQRFALRQRSEPEVITLLYKYFLLGLLSQAQDATHCCRLIGQLFSRQLLSRTPFLHHDDRALILSLSQPHLPASSLAVLAEWLGYSAQAGFHRLCDGLLRVRLSSETGWQTVDTYRLQPLSADDDGPYGLRLSFTLSPGFAAVIPCDPQRHGDIGSGACAAIVLDMQPDTPFFPYSLLHDWVLGSVIIDTQVDGVTAIEVHTPDGQADASKTFYPFGTQPTCPSSLTLASYEVAQKPLHALTLAIDWANLPGDNDGFARHYQRYPGDYRNQAFRAQLSVLRDGEWKNVGQPVALFGSDATSQRLLPGIQIHADVQHDFKPEQSACGSDEPSFDSARRNGLLRLTLCAPGHAFGHRRYSALVSDTLLMNSPLRRRWLGRRQPLPAPNPPYTPAIQRLTLGYRARSRLQPGEPAPAGARHSHLVHLHPFGHAQRYPDDSANGHGCTLFPRYDNDGNVFIALQGRAPGSLLNLFFHLDDRAAGVHIGPAPVFHWHYLVDNRWQAMSASQVIADTTEGFTVSGIITLELPADINDSHTLMPNGHYWLRVSTDEGIGHYANCLHVTPHVVRATRQWPTPEDSPTATGGDTAGAMHRGDTPPSAQDTLNWRVLSPQAGLGHVVQMLPLRPTPARESTDAFRARVSEQLRHKGRALTGWDYERLVLQHFPDIGQVRCFAHTRFGVPGHHPGRLLLLVYPRHHACQHQPCQPLPVSAARLAHIQRYLQTLSPPFAAIDVRAPHYEKVQVRCTVTFEAGQHTGLMLRRLNQDINDYLCPWREESVNRGFGHTVALRQIEAFIAHRSYVRFVTGFSLFTLSCQPGIDTAPPHWQLFDSASEPAAAQIRNPAENSALLTGLTPRYRWNIILPVEQHDLRVSSELTPQPARKTGIGDLTLGESFITVG